MGVLVLASATGSPGVTTTALGLALSWPRDVLLIDVDRDAAQAIESGYLSGSAQGHGLSGLAQELRHNPHGAGNQLWNHAVALPPPAGVSAPEYRRGFISGFTSPSASTVLNSLWPHLVQRFESADVDGADVIVDTGRLGGSGLPVPLFEAARIVLVVTRSSLRSLAALRLHLPALLDRAERDAPGCEVGLCVVGPGRPYSVAEISGHFGLPVLMTVPDEPQVASLLSDGEAVPRNLEQRPLWKAYREAANRLGGRVPRLALAHESAGYAR